MTLLPFIAGLLGLGTVLATVPLILTYCRRAHNLDRGRDMHHGEGAAVPRLGGLALATAFLVVCLFAGIVSATQNSSLLLHPVILLSCLAMFALGFVDDLKPLGARRKLAGQIIIALAVWAFGFGIQTFTVPFTGHIVQFGPWSAAITVLWLVSMTNLINLVDGIDGLAGGISFMLMVLLGYVGHQSDNLELVVAGMGGALLGFLRFNFPPARIYMGDGGAYFLGFQIGLFAIVGSHKGEILAALAAPLFVLALPILDTSLAILRRGLRGLPLFRPDRRHLHHHLLETGMSHRKVVFAFYGVSVVFLAMGVAAYWSRGQLIPVLFGLTVLTLLVCAGQFKFSRRWFAIGRMVENSLNMRREIEYAMCLSKSLALEGRRNQGVENLWQTLAGIAEKLGYVSVKLTLADGAREWVKPGSEWQPRRDAKGREEEVGRVAPRAPSSTPLSPRERDRVRGKETINPHNGRDTDGQWDVQPRMDANGREGGENREKTNSFLFTAKNAENAKGETDGQESFQHGNPTPLSPRERDRVRGKGTFETTDHQNSNGAPPLGADGVPGSRSADWQSAVSRIGNPPPSPILRSFRINLLDGRCGKLELNAPCDQNADNQSQAGNRQRNWARPTITDTGLCETISELVAEGWIKAARNYINGDNQPLRFAQTHSAHQTPEDNGTLTHPLSPRERARVRGKAMSTPHNGQDTNGAAPIGADNIPEFLTQRPQREETETEMSHRTTQINTDWEGQPRMDAKEARTGKN